MAAIISVFLFAPAAAAEKIVYHRPAPPGGCQFGWCYDVWIANADGTNQHLLVGGARLSALSADGQLAAVMNQDQERLHVLTTDGTIRETYANLPGGVARAPRFSPDGQTLIYQGGTNIQDIYSISRGSSVPTLLVGWNGDESFPTFSPDGSKIAFQSNSTPAGASTAGAAWTADSNGSNPFRVTPTSIGSVGSPKFSRDGQSLVFSGNKTKGSGQGPGLWIIGTDGTGLRRLTSGAGDRNPDWSSDGSKIVFERDNDGIYEINPDGTGLQEIINDPSARDPSYRQPRTVVDYSALLQEYAPQLRYDSQENYYADSAAEITDNPGNYLRDGASVPIAASSDPAYPQLSLSFLGSPTYLNGTPSHDTDFLDEVNDTYTADAQRMHSDAFYADRIYGQVAFSDGKYWLQYWLFYYYNDFDIAGFGVHEGDWEMVQIGLDSNGAPDVAAYSQHNDGERCDWDQVEKRWLSTATGGRYGPVVYVARASHASYFTSGQHDRPFPLPSDYAGGDGAAAEPGLVGINSTSPSWVAWPGRWGASTTGEFQSPVGPLYNDGGAKWSSPTGWANGLPECGSGSLSSQAATEGSASTDVSSPRVQATRVGETVRIHYGFSRRGWQRDKQERFLLLSIDSAGRSSSGVGYTPLSEMHRLQQRTGSFTQSIGIGPGPYTVRASAFSRRGSRSLVTVEAVP